MYSTVVRLDCQEPRERSSSFLLLYFHQFTLYLSRVFASYILTLHYLEHRMSWPLFSLSFLSSVMMEDAFSRWISFGFSSPFSDTHTTDPGFSQFAFAWHILEEHFNFNSWPASVLASCLLYYQLSSPVTDRVYRTSLLFKK